MKKIILLSFLFSFYFAQAQNEIKVYPASWWIGMKNPRLQVMVHGKDIGLADFKFQYAGIKLEKIVRVKNPNYIFLNLTIAPGTKPGSVNFYSAGNINKRQFNLVLENPASGNGKTYARGVNSSDFIYLIMEILTMTTMRICAIR